MNSIPLNLATYDPTTELLTYMGQQFLVESLATSQTTTTIEFFLELPDWHILAYQAPSDLQLFGEPEIPDYSSGFLTALADSQIYAVPRWDIRTVSDPSELPDWLGKSWYTEGISHCLYKGNIIRQTGWYLGYNLTTDHLKKLAKLPDTALSLSCADWIPADYIIVDMTNLEDY